MAPLLPCKWTVQNLGDPDGDAPSFWLVVAIALAFVALFCGAAWRACKMVDIKLPDHASYYVPYARRRQIQHIVDTLGYPYDDGSHGDRPSMFTLFGEVDFDSFATEQFVGLCEGDVHPPTEPDDIQLCAEVAPIYKSRAEAKRQAEIKREEDEDKW